MNEDHEIMAERQEPHLAEEPSLFSDPYRQHELEVDAWLEQEMSYQRWYLSQQ